MTRAALYFSLGVILGMAFTITAITIAGKQTTPVCASWSHEQELVVEIREGVTLKCFYQRTEKRSREVIKEMLRPSRRNG